MVNQVWSKIPWRWFEYTALEGGPPKNLYWNLPGETYITEPSREKDDVVVVQLNTAYRGAEYGEYGFGYASDGPILSMGGPPSVGASGPNSPGGFGLGASPPEPEYVGNGLGASRPEPEYVGNDLGASLSEPEYVGNGLGASLPEPEYVGNGLGASRPEPEYVGNGLGASLSEPEYVGNGLGASLLEPDYVRFGLGASPPDSFGGNVLGAALDPGYVLEEIAIEQNDSNWYEPEIETKRPFMLGMGMG